jgi:hypothetical protein
MEDLASSLDEAEWEARGEATFVCTSSEINDQLRRYVPSALKEHNLSAWKKSDGFTWIKSGEGLLVPVKATGEGEAQLLDGKKSITLVQNMEPVPFRTGYMISGSLYYIMAVEPEKTPQDTGQTK